MEGVTPRVLIVEDQTLVRMGIRALLERSKAVEVVGEAGDGRLAVEAASNIKPDMVIMDVSMANLNGIEATRQIKRILPNTRVLMLSMYADMEYVREALRAGADGYVLKDALYGELQMALEMAWHGRTYLSSGVTKIPPDRTDKGGKQYGALNQLTAREREILQLIGEGRSSAEAAQLLSLSVRTVETHRQNIVRKLGVHSVAGLTRFAIRHGLCSLDT